MWEYFTTTYKDLSKADKWAEMHANMAVLGQKGWEAYGVFEHKASGVDIQFVVFFKRWKADERLVDED